MQYIKKSATYFKMSTLAIAFIFTLLILGTLNSTSLNFNFVGLASLSLLLGTANALLIIQFLKHKKMNKRAFTISLVAILFVGVQIIGLLNNVSHRGLINILQFILCIGFTIFLSTLSWDRFKLKLVSNIATVFILITFIYWSISGFPSNFASIYNNPNTLGPFVFFMMFFIFLALKEHQFKLIRYLTLILAIMLIIGSDARSVMVAGVTVLITYLFWHSITKTKFRFYTFIFTIFSLLLSFIYIYPQLPSWEHFYYFESLMLEYTGKSIMSGRDNIWIPITAIINEQPFLGYSPGTTPGDVMNRSSSTHNLYLLLTLQNGYIGLLLFLSLLFLIWKAFWKNRHHSGLRLGASFFIGILIHQSFEVSLTQNELAIGIMQWAIIGISLSFSLNEKSNKSPK